MVREIPQSSDLVTQRPAPLTPDGGPAVALCSDVTGPGPAKAKHKLTPTARGGLGSAPGRPLPPRRRLCGCGGVGCWTLDAGLRGGCWLGHNGVAACPCGLRRPVARAPAPGGGGAVPTPKHRPVPWRRAALRSAARALSRGRDNQQ